MNARAQARTRKHARHMMALPSDPRAQAAVVDLVGRGFRAVDAVRLWDLLTGGESHLAMWTRVMVTLQLDGNAAREWLASHGLWGAS